MFTDSVGDACQGSREGPADQSLVAAVEKRLHEAYGIQLRRMFREPPPDAPADLDITISSPCVQLLTAPDGRIASVETHATISAGTSGQIADVLSRGEAPVLGSDWIAYAGDHAAQDCATNFEAAFANSQQVTSWLLARRVEPIAPTVDWPRRGEWVTFGDIGAGIMFGGGEELANGLLAHFGVANRWFLIQGVAATWSPSFGAASSTVVDADRRTTADLGAYDAGIEGGAVLRLGPASELRGGAGVHELFGKAEASSQGASSSYAITSPVLFAAAQTSVAPTRNGTRLRLGVEVRKYFNTTLGLPELSRTIPAADVYLGVYLGFELSTSRAKQ